MNRRTLRLGITSRGTVLRQCLLTWGVTGAVLACLMSSGCSDSSPDNSPHAAAFDPLAVTYCRDIAPIIFENCTVCHRLGESAPFSLITFEDAREHASQIVEVTQSGYMPPWPPSPGHGEFEDERRLATEQIEMLRRWVEDGVQRGDPTDLPPTPEWPEGWHLGKPDLVVKMPQPYDLPPAGKDVYRNFVMPLELKEPRWVKAVEFRPDNKPIVHHAFILVDRARSGRELEKEDDQPGYEGMDPRGARSPAAQFLSWQPGRLPAAGQDRFAWRLNPGTDLVLQVHMQPTGKPERIQASVGLYFTERPETCYPYKLCLRSTEINIPPGMDDYEFTEQYVLPVDAEVHSVLPHAHYLGKRLEGYATLPDGTRKSLILIEDWDFNWQSDYRYRKPVLLPQGTVITQRFSYDNSAENIRNPHQPPQRARYGLESTDEMGELWIQLLLSSKEDYATLNRDDGRRAIDELIARRRATLRSDPNDVKARVDLGMALLGLGRMIEAQSHLNRAIQQDPRSADAHYYLGNALLRQRKVADAQSRLETAIRLDPDHFLAQHDLGLLHLKTGGLDAAQAHFREAVRIDPYHPVAHSNLGFVLLRLQNPEEAAVHFRRSLEIRPDHAKTRENLLRAEAMLKNK